MAEKNSFHVITASTTESGAAVYMHGDSTWGPDIEAAAVFEPGPERDRMLAVAVGQEQTVCDPYVMDVSRDAAGVRPLSVREEIRSQGPTTPVRRGDPVADFTDEGS